MYYKTTVLRNATFLVVCRYSRHSHSQRAKNQTQPARVYQVLDQQEGEYETELQQLIAAAEAELHGERENTGKLRATLQVVSQLPVVCCFCSPSMTATRAKEGCLVLTYIMLRP